MTQVKPSIPFLSQRGTVLVELVFIAPIILIIAGYTIRLTQVLQAQQIAMVISRESATEAFRKCADISIQAVERPANCTDALCVDVTNTTNTIMACLLMIQSKYQAYWNSMRPSGTSEQTPISIELEVYRHNYGTFTIATECDGSTLNTSTRITPTSSTNNTLPPRMNPNSLSLCNRNRVSRASISFEVSPTAAFLSFVPGFSDTPINISDETVL